MYATQDVQIGGDQLLSKIQEEAARSLDVRRGLQDGLNLRGAQLRTIERGGVSPATRSARDLYVPFSSGELSRGTLSVTHPPAATVKDRAAPSNVALKVKTCPAPIPSPATLQMLSNALGSDDGAGPAAVDAPAPLAIPLGSAAVSLEQFELVRTIAAKDSARMNAFTVYLQGGWEKLPE